MLNAFVPLGPLSTTWPAVLESLAMRMTRKVSGTINDELLYGGHIHHNRMSKRTFRAELTAIVSQAALDFANGICGGAGVSDLPQSATCASDATTTTATASATVTNIEATTSDGKTTTTTAVTSTTESDQTSTEAASSTSADTSTQTSTSTETETPANSEDTDGATPLRGKSVGVLAGIVAGVAFVL
jgi:cobalamin biosynthesis Mg chelatase CobN